VIATGEVFAYCKSMQAFDPEAFIASQSWTFAKTMPSNPHYYIVRGRGNTSAEFEAFVRFIRVNGEKRVWGRGRNRKIYIYWQDAQGRRYWTMGWPIPETTVINRVDPENDNSVPFDPHVHFGLKWSGPNGQDPHNDVRLYR